MPLVFASIATLFVATVAALSPSMPPHAVAAKASGPPFDPAAIFNRPVPADHPTDRKSRAAVAAFTAMVRDNPTGTHLKTSGEVPAVNHAAGSDPLRRFETRNISGRFRIPARLRLGKGNDHPTVVVNGVDELRIWQARWDGKTLRGTYGGRFWRNNDGSRMGGERSLGGPYAGGGAGNGLTYSAGLNVPRDWPRPRHALRAAIDSRFVRSSYRPPARKSDQRSTASYAVPMGAIFQIRPRVDCDARANPVARTLCRQLQTYGLMISDGSSRNQLVLYHEDDATADWERVLGPRCSADSWSCRIRPGSGSKAGLPWKARDWRLVAAPRSYTAW